MRNFVTLILFLITINSFSNVPLKQDIRNLFQKAATEELACKGILSILQNYNEKNDALLAGYKACAIMMMANYVFNPYTKYEKFLEGKSLLEKAVDADKQNIELRFLRFAAQANAPFFLFYKSSIEDDKNFIVMTIDKLEDKELKQFMIPYLLKSDYLTEIEKQNIKA